VDRYRGNVVHSGVEDVPSTKGLGEVGPMSSMTSCLVIMFNRH